MIIKTTDEIVNEDADILTTRPIDENTKWVRLDTIYEWAKNQNEDTFEDFIYDLERETKWRMKND